VREAVVVPLRSDECGRGYRPIASSTQLAALVLSTSHPAQAPVSPEVSGRICLEPGRPLLRECPGEADEDAAAEKPRDRSRT
jgi:hypothetical protein